MFRICYAKGVVKDLKKISPEQLASIKVRRVHSVSSALSNRRKEDCQGEDERPPGVAIEKDRLCV
jgi:hypothetical protein